MAMTDEERRIEALAKARVKGVDKQDWIATTNANRSWHIRAASEQLAALRALGGDVTMPPAPEPTYTIRLTDKQLRGYLELAEYGYGTDPLVVLLHGALANPDPEPGA